MLMGKTVQKFEPGGSAMGAPVAENGVGTPTGLAGKWNEFKGLGKIS